MINIVDDENFQSLILDLGTAYMTAPLKSFVNNDISIDRDSEILVVRPGFLGGFVRDTYYFDLSTWTSRYGKPVELMLALHLATMMPDLTYDLATMEEFNTKVDLAFSRVDVEYTVSYQGVTIPDDVGKAKKALEEAEISITDEQIKELVNLASGGEEGFVEWLSTLITGDTAWPRITAVRNHWFYEDFTFDYGKGATIEQTITYTPDGEDDPLADIASNITLAATISNSYYQLSDPNPEGPNENIKKLFLGDGDEDNKFPGKYYQYDGTRERAQVIANAKAVDEGKSTYTFDGQEYEVEDKTISKEPVNFQVETKLPNGQEIKGTKNAFEAFSILEGMKSEAAEKIYRNLQELLIELDYFTEEDFQVPSTEVLEWILPGHTPPMWPIREANEYGAFIRSENNLEDGFSAGEEVVAPADATITEIGSDSIKLKLKAIDDATLTQLQRKLGEDSNVVLDGNSVLDMEILIQGITVDSSLTVSQEIKRGDTIGATTEEDIHVIMYNKDKSVVDNLVDYLTPNYGGALNVVLGTDYVVNTATDSNNVIRDAQTFKAAFSSYDNIVANADAFLEMQEQYGVNAVFAAAVTIAESSGGTNWAAIPEWSHNMFSITGSYNGQSYTSSNGMTWRVYPSFEEAIMDFGELISTSSYYFGGGNYSITDICQAYCGGSSTWSTSVSNAMTNALKKASASSSSGGGAGGDVMNQLR